MKRIAAVLMLAVTACGGGDPKPAATTAPPVTPGPTTTPSPVAPAGPAATKAVHAAVAKTLAACPCGVTIVVTSMDLKNPATRSELRGVYDPRTQATSLASYHGEKPTRLRLRIVDGRVFVTTRDAWGEVSFAKMPGAEVTVFGHYALVDPRIAFAAASSASSAYAYPVSGVLANDVTYDIAATTAKAGPWAAMLRRMTPKAVSFYGNVFVKGGLVDRVMFDTPTLPGKPHYAVTVEVTATGQAPQRLTVPRPSYTFDASSDEGLPS